MTSASPSAGAAAIGVVVLAVTCCLGAPLLAAAGIALVGASLFHAWPVAISLTLLIALLVAWRLLLQTKRFEAAGALSSNQVPTNSENI